ncbi:hypothetical protein ALC57_01095 [Trachymyrmex cornetzi]|uniref:DUF7041 domain-containing protein n=1 Tax=Trachymyrmex cornetzi TaxID=471704 RepID=A0A151JR52_9HYME|nr:hypothetical protein ALC57_01095 [Trachymyrmex cornetzi]
MADDEGATLEAGSNQNVQDTTGGGGTGGTVIVEIRNLKLPPFWKKDPVLWFEQVEAQFYTHRIRSDTLKYYTVVAAVDAEDLTQVSDILRNPPSTDKYKHFKDHIILRFTESKERQLQKLLTGLELADKKPSQLLREMRSLAANNLTDDIIHTLWMRRMPEMVKCVLSASEGVDLEKLAIIADRLIEHQTPAYVMAASTSRAKQDDEDSVSTRVSKLETMFTELMTNLKKANTPRRSRSRSTSQVKHRSSSQGSSQSICYYHTMYGKQARKCKQPCSFETLSTQEN